MIVDIKKHIKNKTNVYSLEDGAGEITGIFKLYDGVDDYLEIDFFESEGKKYFPITSSNKIRLSSSSNVLTQALVDLGEKLNSKNFKFELSYYHPENSSLDILYIINVIASLSSQNSFSIENKEMLSRCLRSLVLEVSHVYGISIQNAKGVVGDHMRLVA